MEWLGGFVLGLVTDFLRAAFLPASTEWIKRFFPSYRNKANVEENILTLNIMEKLKSLGKDPDLVRHSREDAAKFMSVLTSQKEAFVSNAIEVIDSTYMSQAEMNTEAGRRADVAQQQMERALIALERSHLLNGAQIDALKEAQIHWNQYAQSQAKFASAEFEGGSMAPLIHAGELEVATVSRTAELRRILEEMRERNAISI